MTDFYIRLKLETDETIDIKCKDVADYAVKVALLEEHFPHLKWHEMRV